MAFSTIVQLQQYGRANTSLALFGRNQYKFSPVLQMRSGFNFLGSWRPVNALTMSPTTITVKQPQAEYHMYESSYKEIGCWISSLDTRKVSLQNFVLKLSILHCRGSCVIPKCRGQIDCCCSRHSCGSVIAPGRCQGLKRNFEETLRFRYLGTYANP